VHIPRPYERYILILGVVVILAGLIAASDALHAKSEEIIVFAEGVISRVPVLGMLLFVLLTMVSAMLVFFSSAILVPVGVYAWGATVTLILLWIGWFLGGAVAFAVGRYLGRSVVTRIVGESTIANFEKQLSGRTRFLHIVLFQAALPSEIPSLQLDFLTTLTSYARKGVLFATHSIGLARSSADWIYSIRRIDEGVSELNDFEATSNLSEFLGELNFSGYRELGFNKILLVEGVTDVKTVQQFLRWHRKDHEIVLLPLGGSQFINGNCEAQLDEIKRISHHVFALIDSERASAETPLNPDRQAFVDVCKRAEIICQVLDRRAIENYFTDQAIKVVNSDKYQALEPYQALREAAYGWAKEQNWRIARHMEPQDLMETDLGQFLSSL